MEIQAGPVQRDRQEAVHRKPRRRVQEVEPCGGEAELGCDSTPLSLFGLKDCPGVSSLGTH